MRRALADILSAAGFGVDASGSNLVVVGRPGDEVLTLAVAEEVEEEQFPGDGPRHADDLIALTETMRAALAKAGFKPTVIGLWEKAVGLVVDPETVVVEPRSSVLWIRWESSNRVMAYRLALPKPTSAREAQALYLNDPIVRFDAAVNEAMMEALADVSAAMGFDVLMDVNDYDPYGIYVKGFSGPEAKATRWRPAAP
ncbi:hypothetical protein [Actinoplanes sp. URMC 104]|uniref:hypothetical protein n=1 Tax=Actinoplanes sp. URMC 104 TaxID=3423409 RepID=UPI003F1A30C8